MSVSIRPAGDSDLDFLVELYNDEDVRPFLATGGSYDRDGVTAKVEQDPDAGAVVGAGGGEKGTDVAVGVELRQEVDVGRRRRADGHPGAHGRTVAASRRGKRTAPEASAIPPRISASPASIVALIASSRMSAP